MGGDFRGRMWTVNDMCGWTEGVCDVLCNFDDVLILVQGMLSQDEYICDGFRS